MWNDDDAIEALEAYAEGRMSGEEQRAFEVRLAEDPDLAGQLHAFRSTRAAIIQANGDERVRALLKKTEQRAGAGSGSWIQWAAAAAIVLLIGSAAWYWSRSSNSLPALAETYMVPESALPVFMSATPDVQRSLDRSMQHFGAGEYAQALAQLELLPSTDTTAFYTGVCKEQLDQDPTAHFQQVVDKLDSPFRAKAMYHLMLWHMKQDHRAEALHLLKEQRSLKEHPYRERLEALAASLDAKP